MSDYDKVRSFLQTHDFWDIVEEIGWREACANWRRNGEKKIDTPTRKLKAKVVALTGGDTDIASKLHDIVNSYGDALKEWVESYSYEKYGDHHAFPNNSGKVSVSDDGWWDLRAHIIGCGKEAYLKAINHPETIPDDYPDDSDRAYVENFGYIFYIDE